MRKVVIAIACVIVLISLLLTGKIIYNAVNSPKTGIGDKTVNINVMLTRPSGWEKIISDPVINKNKMDMIDGSTATLPITAEILRQFYDYTDDLVNQSGFCLPSSSSPM